MLRNRTGWLQPARFWVLLAQLSNKSLVVAWKNCMKFINFESNTDDRKIMF